jgi:hypothetical protein
MKKTQQTYLLLGLSLAFLFSSCDFGTREYYTYTTNDGYNEIYFLWGDSSRCGLTICDTTIKFDGLNLFFPSDKSAIKGYCETYYVPIRNDKREIVDSVANCGWHFDITENDPRIAENSFTILYMLNGNALVFVDTLFRKKEKITILDQLPLPKLH